MVEQRLIEIKNLKVATNNNASVLVNDVSFSIKSGSITALVGESGAGKSITGLSLTRLAPSTLTYKGEVIFNNTNLLAASEPYLQDIRGKEIAMIFQEPMTALNPLHTIGKQLAEVLYLHNPAMHKLTVIERIKELLSDVGLPEFEQRLHNYPHQLSGGQRQRIMIAMAIANHPKLLVADEPTTALDIKTSEEIIDLLKQIQKSSQMAVLLITHDLAIVRKVSEYIYVMKDGSIIESGTAHDIFTAPKHEYTKFLTHSEPKRLVNTMAVANMPVLMSTNNLSVAYPKNTAIFSWRKDEKAILENINLEIRQGETLGLVGQSGSGKSSLAMALLRLIKSKGEINFAGRRVDLLNSRDLRSFRRDIQIVFQDPFASLNPRFKVFDSVAEGVRAHNILKAYSNNELESMVYKVLSEVGLDRSIIYRYPHELSGGQRQRVVIARALILNPKLVILDEPTSALDKPVQKQVLELLFDLQSKYGIAYLLISHDMAVIQALSHRIVRLDNGKLYQFPSSI